MDAYLAAFETDGIRFMILGMSAAIAQGVMGSTLDIDVWIDLPPPQDMRGSRNWPWRREQRLEPTPWCIWTTAHRSILSKG